MNLFRLNKALKMCDINAAVLHKYNNAAVLHKYHTTVTLKNLCYSKENYTKN